MEKAGHRRFASTLASDRDPKGLWIGFGFKDGGIVHFDNGRAGPLYSTADGLGGGMVSDIRLDRDGTLWDATEGGLSVIKNGRVTTLTSRNGLCDSILWTREDDDQRVWLYTPCGLMRVARPELETAAADPKRTIPTTVFDTSDGVRLHSIPVGGYSPQVTRASDGKLWFLSAEGVSIIDPRHLPFNKLPPPVHVERVTADGKVYDLKPGMRLPALVTDVSIDYTALSLVAPEKVHFKYKLEGQDRDWKEVINDRHVRYSNLPPRRYSFRVTAANNSGVWNESGAFLDFSIDPAYYQTMWFRALLAAAILAIAAALYLLRTHQLARQFDMRMQERVNERLRIARDLHDTLLQNFQGVLLKFSAATYSLPDAAAESRDMFEDIIEQARDAITEGRDAVQGLRSSTLVPNDLARSIILCGKGLAREQGTQNPAGFRVNVEGESRDLPPLVRDEVYRIALEALRNSFRHSEANQIEVEIRCDPRRFTMRVRDNGKGIDPQVLESGGRSGHHGLPGMHERASLAGGMLEVWSKPGAGTEIELTISAAIAYRKVTLPHVPKSAS